MNPVKRKDHFVDGKMMKKILFRVGVLMAIALGLIFQRLFVGLGSDAAPLCLTGLACALYILASSLVESTLLKTSLQQVVSGYLLAIAWVVSPAPTQENSRTISP